MARVCPPGTKPSNAGNVFKCPPCDIVAVAVGRVELVEVDIPTLVTVGVGVKVAKVTGHRL